MRRSSTLIKSESSVIRHLGVALQERFPPDEIAHYMDTVLRLGLDPVTHNAVSFADRQRMFELMLAYGYGKPMPADQLAEMQAQHNSAGAGTPLIPGLEQMSLEQINQQRRQLLAVMLPDATSDVS